jgi:hypothetical protein
MRSPAIMRLVSAVKKMSGQETFDTMNDDTVQYQMAAQLREAAINHLRSSRQPVASRFRGTHAYTHDFNGPLNFLRTQATNGAWGTDIEAIALGEFFGVHVVVTPITETQPGNIRCLYQATDPQAPVIHLYNSDNNHWHYHADGAKTKGDGNCLYNAFSQALLSYVKPEQTTVAAPSAPTTSASKSTHTEQPRPSLQAFFPAGKKIEDQSAIAGVIAQQQKIYNDIRKASDKKTQKSEPISYKPTTLQQEQINSDYAFALQLAAEEMGRTPRL